MKWSNIKHLISPIDRIEWLNQWASASCVTKSPLKEHYNLFITGRDSKGRGQLGKAILNIERKEIVKIEPMALCSLGEKGAFDDNGMTYPYPLEVDNQLYLYYTGWQLGAQVPWINGLGLLCSEDGIHFKRYSRAPIFHRNNEDFIGIGSSAVIYDEGKYKLWYTSIRNWAKDPRDHKHHYYIKYAESDNGIDWSPLQKVCINFAGNDEYAIAKPSVIKYKDHYFMWYSYRGEYYKIGFAISKDGINWVRKDHLLGLDRTSDHWSNEMVCYSYVFRHQDHLYMLFNGNGYGRSGLGIAEIEISDFEYLVF